MSSKEMAVEIHGLCKRFQENEVLKDLDLEVPKGKVFALLGQNGAGKTTIVKILSTLLNFDSGKVTVLSHKLPKESDEVRSKIGLTGQYVALDEDMTGEQNLILIARLLGYKKEDAKIRANELLDMFDLSDAKNKTVKTYSGGMHRRLDIASSIIKTPELLFLDEPTTGLDPRSRSVVWDFVKKLSKNGTTIFLTTQYLDEADRLADLIAVLNDGKIVAKGTPTKLKSLVGRKKVNIRLLNDSEFNHAKTVIVKNTSFSENDIMESELGLLSIEISNIEEANTILNELASSKIEPVEYSFAGASLDEVFLSFTKEGKK